MPRYPVEVAIEYDARGKRVRKLFTDPYAARRFWILKDKQGKRPRVCKVTR